MRSVADDGLQRDHGDPHKSARRGALHRVRRRGACEHGCLRHAVPQTIHAVDLGPRVPLAARAGPGLVGDELAVDDDVGGIAAAALERQDLAGLAVEQVAALGEDAHTVGREDLGEEGVGQRILRREEDHRAARWIWQSRRSGPLEVPGKEGRSQFRLLATRRRDYCSGF